MRAVSWSAILSRQMAHTPQSAAARSSLLVATAPTATWHRRKGKSDDMRSSTAPCEQIGQIQDWQTGKEQPTSPTETQVRAAIGTSEEEEEDTTATVTMAVGIGEGGERTRGRSMSGREERVLHLDPSHGNARLCAGPTKP
jgi:hypothetical protein